MEEPKNIVLHIEMTPEGLISAQLPDNQIVALGILTYIRERYMEQVVRPSFQSRIALPTSN